MTRPPALASPATPLGERLRASVPAGARRMAGGLRLRAATASARWRPLPDTLIVGAMRAGTTSLFRWLSAHPLVDASVPKEVEFFSRHYARGEAWYRGHFPLARWASNLPSRRVEATPDYLLDPRAPERAARMLPEARILILLRDPVERAWSHWWTMRRLGLEPLGFEAALEAEAERLAPAWAELAADPEAALPAAIRRYAYAGRSRYAEQVQRWLDRYPRERVMALKSEDVYARPAEELKAVQAFLGLPAWQPPELARYEWDHRPPAERPRPSEALRARLRGELAGSIEPLAGLLGPAFRWS